MKMGENEVRLGTERDQSSGLGWTEVGFDLDRERLTFEIDGMGLTSEYVGSR